MTDWISDPVGKWIPAYAVALGTDEGYKASDCALVAAAAVAKTTGLEQTVWSCLASQSAKYEGTGECQNASERARLTAIKSLLYGTMKSLHCFVIAYFVNLAHCSKSSGT